MFQIRVQTSGPFFNKRYRETVLERNLAKIFGTSLLLLDREVSKRTPVIFGTLRRSIYHEITGYGLSLKGMVGSLLKYAMTVETGRKARSSFPNIDSLTLYAKRKYHLSGRELEKAVFFIGSRIRQHGFKGQWMFRNAFLMSTAKIKTLFGQYGLKVVKDLS